MNEQTERRMSIREMMIAMNMKSPAVVQARLEHLRRKKAA